MSSPGNKVSSQVHSTLDGADHEDGLRWATQAGLICRGIVYVVFGIIAFNLSRGDDSSGAPSTRGALAELASKSYGTVLLAIVGVGLGLYAVACAIAAIRGRGGKKPGESDTKDRAMDAFRAVINGGLAIAAFRVIASGKDEAETGSSTEKEAAGGILGLPGGRVLVAIAALALFGWAIWQIRKVVKDKFAKGLDLSSLSARGRNVVLWIGRIGYTGKAIVFAIVGVFLLRAALDDQSKEAEGIDGALRRFANETYGPTVLLFVGVGVIAFGIWSMVEGKYRREGGA